MLTPTELFHLAPEFQLAAPTQEQTPSRRWKHEELLQLAGMGEWPNTSSTPVARFSGKQTLFLPRHPETGGESTGEIPVNSHLKVDSLFPDYLNLFPPDASPCLKIGLASTETFP